MSFAVSKTKWTVRNKLDCEQLLFVQCSRIVEDVRGIRNGAFRAIPAASGEAPSHRSSRLRHLDRGAPFAILRALYYHWRKLTSANSLLINGCRFIEIVFTWTLLSQRQSDKLSVIKRRSNAHLRCYSVGIPLTKCHRTSTSDKNRNSSSTSAKSFRRCPISW